MVYKVFEDNIHIEDSYDCTKTEMREFIKYLRDTYPTNPVLKNRSTESMVREWCAHNFLYKIGLFRTHTKDVDLNYPQKWYISVVYFIFGSFAMLFIKK